MNSGASLRRHVVSSQPGDHDDGVLLETKLHPPRPRAEWVERTELVQYLTSCTARLVLVEAPAGYGKSILVAQWRASPGEARRFAWVSIDSGDNDPVRLWWHIVCALQRACPELETRDLLRHLRIPGPEQPNPLLHALVNELAALPAPLVLVLDDYHELSNSSCHEQVAFFVSHLPPMAQIVLITRAEPPLPLPIGRLRAAGDLAEVRTEELRFEAAAVDKLLQEVGTVHLDEADRAVLVERAEGWPAGVYLAALSLRDHPSPSDFVRQFTGTNRFVLEFLAEEVLSRLPDQTMRFLYQTAILDRFNPSLCDAVTGTGNAVGIIAVLKSENLFLVNLDSDRQWFRYCHLFRGALLNCLMETEPGIVPALHTRASRWHRRQGSVEEAITHALAAGDEAAGIDVIADSWPHLVDSGRTAVFRAAMNRLGESRILASPVAAHCAAWCAAISGELESLKRWTAVIEAAEHEGPLPDGMQSLKSSAALLRGVFGFAGIRDMRESASRAASMEADSASPWYVLARTALGAALYVSGEFEAAAVPLSDAMQHDASIALIRVLACSVTGLVATELGRLRQAQELAHMARDFIAADDVSEAPCHALVHTAGGAVAARLGDLARARGDFEKALRDRSRWIGIIPWATVDAMLRLASTLGDLGDHAGSVALLGEARDMLTSLPDGAEAQLFRIEQMERHLLIRSESPPHLTPLTGREEEVLQLLRSPLSVREIGQELFVSPNTVKTHVRAIYRKLGAATRREAVERGHKVGIL